MSSVSLSPGAISVTSSAYATVLQYPSAGYGSAGFSWEVADQALASVKVQVAMGPDDAWDDLLVDADLEDGANPLLIWGKAGSYNAAAAARGKAAIRLPTCYAVRLLMKSATGTASVTPHATFATEGG